MQSKILILFIAFVWQHSFAAAQTFAIATGMNKAKFAPILNSETYGVKRKMCGSTVGGMVAMPIGLVVFTGGLVSGTNTTINYDGHNTAHKGENAMIVGGIIFLSGAALLINGIIHDRACSRRFRVISPKTNEIGVAYNL